MKLISCIFCILALSYSVSGWSQEQSNVTTPVESVVEEQEVKEKKYVTDKLRLSLYKEADSGSGTLRLLTSGDVVYVLERSGPYSKVRTEDRTTGWVKNGFLQNTMTSTYQLIEVQNKNKQLMKQLEKYADTKTMVQQYEKSIEQLNNEKTLIQQETQLLQQQISELTEDKNELKQNLDSSLENEISPEEMFNQLKKFWHILVLSLLLIFLTGFYLGKQILEAKIRRRFQGIKVW